METWTIPIQVWENKVFQIIWLNRFENMIRVPKSLGYPVGKVRHTMEEMEALAKRKRFSKIKRKLEPEVFHRLGHNCLYCGEKAEVLDHVVPIAWGGTNDIENMQPICRRCNSKKGGNLPSGKNNG